MVTLGIWFSPVLHRTLAAGVSCPHGILFWNVLSHPRSSPSSRGPGQDQADQGRQKACFGDGLQHQE